MITSDTPRVSDVIMLVITGGRAAVGLGRERSTAHRTVR
jgi:hypothetical protein